jgi:hypothetical protein
MRSAWLGVRAKAVVSVLKAPALLACPAWLSAKSMGSILNNFVLIDI